MLASLEEKGVHFIELHRVFLILSSLDESYNALVSSLELLPEAHMSMEYLCSRLLEEAEKHQERLLHRPCDPAAEDSEARRG